MTCQIFEVPGSGTLAILVSVKLVVNMVRICQTMCVVDHGGWRDEADWHRFLTVHCANQSRSATNECIDSYGTTLGRTEREGFSDRSPVARPRMQQPAEF